MSRPTQQILRHLYRHTSTIPKASSASMTSQTTSFLSLTQRRSYPRSMVTITKTKAGETVDAPPPLPAADTTTTASNEVATDEEITITTSCANRIKQLSQTRAEDDLYLRIYVDAGGCSGFQYKFNLESNTPSSPSYNHEEGGIDPDDDVVFLKDGVRVVIDTNSLDFVRGSTADYVQEMIKSSFEVRENPNSENACGCGSSFAMKKFSQNPALD